MEKNAHFHVRTKKKMIQVDLEEKWVEYVSSEQQKKTATRNGQNLSPIYTSPSLTRVKITETPCNNTRLTLDG